MQKQPYPWKDIVGKKVSKLRSIAELRAFDGMSYVLCLTIQFLMNSVPCYELQLFWGPDRRGLPGGLGQGLGRRTEPRKTKI